MKTVTARIIKSIHNNEGNPITVVAFYCGERTARKGFTFYHVTNENRDEIITFAKHWSGWQGDEADSVTLVDERPVVGCEAIVEEQDTVVEGLRNPFIGSMTRNTRARIEEYLEMTMPGKWDEWNVRMTKRSWDREDRIMRDIEGRSDV